MHPRRLRFVVWILFLSLTTIMAAGCAAETPTATAEMGAYLTDPLLREFYVSLGARDVLGPAITALFNYRSKQCQYVQNALLCFDPLAQGASRYSLSAPDVSRRSAAACRGKPHASHGPED